MSSVVFVFTVGFMLGIAITSMLWGATMLGWSRHHAKLVEAARAAKSYLNGLADVPSTRVPFVSRSHCRKLANNIREALDATTAPPSG